MTLPLFVASSEHGNSKGNLKDCARVENESNTDLGNSHTFSLLAEAQAVF